MALYVRRPRRDDVRIGRGLPSDVSRLPIFLCLALVDGCLEDFGFCWYNCNIAISFRNLVKISSEPVT